MSTVNTWQAFLRGTKLSRDTASEAPGLKPLWTVNLDEEEDILEWHKNVNDELDESHNRRTSNYIRNRDIYAGLHSNARGRVGVASDPTSEWGTTRFRMPEIVVNHSFELTEQWVSKLSRFSTTVDILPVNTEEGDRNKARAAQRYANHLADTHDFKGLFLNFIRDSKIGGESYLFINYDENAGDLHPDQKKADEKGVRVKLKDDKGNQILSENGDPLFIEKKQRVGDLSYRMRSVPEVLLQPKARFKDVEWARETDLVDIDDLKRMYPKKALSIGDAVSARDNIARGTGGADVSNSVFVYTYWHKRTEAMDSGRKIVLIDNGVLHNEPNPFSGAPLPFVRLTDIDIEGELHGWSFLNNIVTMQIALNKLYTLWYKNIALGSHLYWLVPANARIARDKIRNSASVLQYHGTQKPEIAVFKTVSSDLMTLIDKLEQRILTVSRIQSTSRGELPPNVEAGVAIGILEEQENQAATPDIKKVNAAVEKLFKISLGIAGDMFEKSDGRTSRILGKEGEFLLETLDTQKLSGPYDIKIKKATAISQSKPLMIQQITQLEAMRPGFLKDTELYDLLDLGDRDKFYDVATAALRAAEFENEQLKDGNDIQEPAKGEFALVHWRAHMTMLQGPTYQATTSDKVKGFTEDHIGITEMNLTEGAKKNIKLAALLSDEEYFPAFYIPDFAIPEILKALEAGDTVPLLGEPDEPEQGQGSLLPDQTNELVPDDVPPEQLAELEEALGAEQGLPPESGNGAPSDLL